MRALRLRLPDERLPRCQYFPYSLQPWPEPLVVQSCGRLHIPRCSHRDALLHLVFVLVLGVMVGCAALSVLYLKADKGYRYSPLPLPHPSTPLPFVQVAGYAQ